MSCAKAMIHKFVAISLTAVAMQSDGTCEDTDDIDYLQQLQYYLDSDEQSVGSGDCSM